MRFNSDKFRPLRNFIIGETQQPAEKAIKLLAVLINLEPRPYKSSDWVHIEGICINQHEDVVPTTNENTVVPKKKIDNSTKQTTVLFDQGEIADYSLFGFSIYDHSKRK